MKSDKQRIGVLGGGLTGLALAKFLKCKVDVLEKENSVGGLCRSFCDNGFTFDFGGAHAVFSRDKKILSRMLKLLSENKIKQYRNAKVFFKDRFIKYPFENALNELDKQDNFECLYYFIECLKNPKKVPKNFKEWLIATFGKGIADKYLIPYNEKIWNYDTAKMSTNWVGGRVPQPPIEDIIKSSLGIPTEGYKHQLNFYYPLHNGIEGFIRALKSPRMDIVENFCVKKISKMGSKWYVSNGEVEKRYDHIISTVPIFDLIGSLDNVPLKIHQALKLLRFNSLIAVMIGVSRKNLSDKSWVYFPDKELLFHKISFPANYSKYTVPPGKSSVLVEITANKGDGIWELSEDVLTKRIICDLARIGIIKESEVCYKKILRSLYAYVVYDHNHAKSTHLIREYIAAEGIHLCGRFAEFEYLNMDACFKKALDMARHINTKFMYS